MNLKKILLPLICLFTVIACSCAGSNLYEGKTKVVFNLEGGTYKNSQRAIVHYYSLEDSGSGYISDPESLSGGKIVKNGYSIEGWYAVKTGEGADATYSEKWDFSADTITSEGVTLYAKWVKDIRYTYNVCYLNDKQEKIVLGEYTVEEGGVFKDKFKYAEKRTDGIYTPIGYYDKDAKPWDDSFTHPGGDESLAIDVYVHYVEGRFSIVSSAKELKAAIKGNIYLNADIDMQGETLSFGNYAYKFYGNGHEVKNFTINYDPGKDGLREDIDATGSGKCLYVTLFGEATDAVIEEVTFSNVKVNVSTTFKQTSKIYVLPIATKLSNATISNVSFSGTYEITKLPDGFADENLIISEEAFYEKDSSSVVTDVAVDFKKAE